MYDYIIVGAGPTGLTLALYLAKLNKKIIVIEKENTIGGIHRVKRENGLFTEHGPRIYLNNFVNFMQILNILGTSFQQLFTKYNYQLLSIAGKSIQNFNIKELIILSYKLITINSINRKQTVLEFAKEYNFSQQAINYMDRLCRLSDGASSKRYTIYQFIQLINQNSLNSVYIPKLPNDISLFAIWKQKLQKLGVKFLLNTKLIDMNYKGRIIIDASFKSKDKQFKLAANNYILAIPPRPLIRFLEKSNIKHAYGDHQSIKNWAYKSRYLTYITVAFHWNQKINLPKIWGFPSNQWGIIYIVYTDYMKFKHKDSKTVIIASISKHVKSSYINKTPNQCNQLELKNEVLRQLKDSFPNLPKPTHSILNQNTYKNNKWISNDSAFMLTKHGYLDPFEKYTNLFSCGTHNGYSDYAFTSIESAVTNALQLIHTIEPISKSKFPMKYSSSIRQIIFKIFILIFAIIMLYPVLF